MKFWPDNYAERSTREIPKGLESFSPGLRGTSYPGKASQNETNPERALKGLNQRLSSCIVAPRFWFTPFFPPKTVAHFCATNRYARNCTVILAASSRIT